MTSSWEVLYKHGKSPTKATVIIRPASSGPSFRQTIGFVLLAISLGGFAGPFIPALRLEATYAISQVFPTPTPTPTPEIVAPQPDPELENQFQLQIPKIGVDAPIIANVDPSKPESYDEALLQGVAHASTSFLPDQNGTVYLFSHSTNYDWFVKDLNAVFYLLKNLTTGDEVAIQYKGKTYTYIIRETKIVSARDISYLIPTLGTKNLILETCWPPGSTTERLIVTAGLTN